jgi:CHAT domain-containing protein
MRMHVGNKKYIAKLSTRLSIVTLMILSFCIFSQNSQNEKLKDSENEKTLNLLIEKLYDFSDSILYCRRLDSLRVINNKIFNDTTRYTFQVFHDYCLAQLQLEKRNYANAEPLLELCIRNINPNYQLPYLNSYYSLSYKWLGEIKKSQGKYQESIEAFQNSIVYEDGLPYTIASTEKLIGETYALQDEWKNAMKHYRQSLGILKKFYKTSKSSEDKLETEKRFIRVYESIATFFRIHNNIDSARYYLDQRRPFLAINTESNMIDSHILDGQINFETGKYEEAKHFFSKALGLAKSQYDRIKIAEVYSSRANLYFQLGRFHNARMESDSAMMYLKVNQHVVYKKDYLTALAGKTNALIASYIQEEKEDTSSLNSIFFLAKEGVTLIDSLSINFQNLRDKRTLLGLQRKIFSNGIWVSDQLFKKTSKFSYLEEALNFSESSRSATLRSFTQVDEIKKFVGVPDSILTKDDHMRIQVAAMEHATRLGGSIAQSDVFLHDFSLLKLKRQYFLKDLEKEYPNYFAIKYKSKKVNLKEFQKKLSADGCVLEFFLSKEFVYGFLISPKGIQFKKLDISEEVINAQLSEILRFTNGDAENKEAYHQTAFFLYQKLIAPFEPELGKEIIIVPDGNLTQLPFETLLFESTGSDIGFSKLPYLLKKYVISYHYAANLLFKENVRSQAKLDLAVFAPSFKDEPNFQDINSLTFFEENFKNSIVFKNETATTQNFKSNLAKCKVLHINTHGIADESIGDLSYLKLSNGDFYSGELYASKINADLVTLSACQTAKGEIKSGEGTVGLTLGFLYAGAKSIVSSLWNVNQQSTGSFMQEFYKRMFQDKEPTNHALRDAKLAMINDNPNFSHPKYWAPFVLVGEPNLGSSTFDFKIFILGILILMVILFIAFRFRHKLPLRNLFQ